MHDGPMTQAGFAYRFEWGPHGVRTLAPVADVVVVVDVLRFTTAVTVAAERGAEILPYRWADDGAEAFAASHDAVLAGHGDAAALSLSPRSIADLARTGLRLVLPSPNGSALALAAREHGASHVLAGCLRNATAVAAAARRLATRADGRPGVIALVAAGERWRGDTGPLRPAVEDLLGAGAVLAALDPAAALSPPCGSPEAGVARAAFVAARPLLFEALMNTGSGRELAARGLLDDVALASQLDATTVVPVLVDEAFTALHDA
jgi:2-phosphosulfolactate phosphatase